VKEEKGIWRGEGGGESGVRSFAGERGGREAPFGRARRESEEGATILIGQSVPSFICCGSIDV